jgi:predicted membrane chloride channel (bestrophin family)
VCERIKNTPLPFPYTLLLHRTIYLFCILLPFAMAEPLGWLTPLFTAIVSYTFFGLDAIADELEDPFGRDENDLATDSLVRTIERYSQRTGRDRPATDVVAGGLCAELISLPRKYGLITLTHPIIDLLYRRR